MAVVTIRVEEIIMVAVARALGSRQLSLVMLWKTLSTAILRTKVPSAGSQSALRASPWPEADPKAQVPEVHPDDICSARSQRRQEGRPHI